MEFHTLENVSVLWQGDIMSEKPHQYSPGLVLLKVLAISQSVRGRKGEKCQCKDSQRSSWPSKWIGPNSLQQ